MSFVWILLIFVAGIFFSAFFSGSETGLYRVSRTRLLIDAMAGKKTAEVLLWFTNHPALFIATTLIGNNLANYLTSLSIVMLTQALFAQPDYLLETSVVLIVSPILYIYGELLPKILYYQAPKRLLYTGLGLFLLCSLLFTPLSLLLWGLGYGLYLLLGQSPEQVQLALARKELKTVFEEGERVGVLNREQKEIAHNIFTSAQTSLKNIWMPLYKVPAAPLGTPTHELQELAKQHDLSYITIYDQKSDDLLGYFRTLELYTTNDPDHPRLYPFTQMPAAGNVISTLLAMRTQHLEIVQIIDEEGQPIALLELESLLKLLIETPADHSEFDPFSAPSPASE